MRAVTSRPFLGRTDDDCLSPNSGLVRREEIAHRIEELAHEIAQAKPRNLLVVAVLKGSFMFAADLIRALHRVGLEPQVEFVHLSSYLDGTVSSARWRSCATWKAMCADGTCFWSTIYSNPAARSLSPRTC